DCASTHERSLFVVAAVRHRIALMITAPHTRCPYRAAKNAGASAANASGLATGDRKGKHNALSKSPEKPRKCQHSAASPSRIRLRVVKQGACLYAVRLSLGVPWE